MQKISAVIITYNEEKSIERCIQSVIDLVDEVIIVDSFSTDRTAEICINLGATVIYQEFLGYKEQKNFATWQASNDYIISLDADEALSAELRNSILKEKNHFTFDGYLCSRIENYCGKWIYHTTLNSHRKLRLFNRRKGKYAGINPHDRFELDPGAKSGRLRGAILHWGYSTIEQHIDKINLFSSISAREYFKLGKKAGFAKILLHPLWRFIHSYLVKTGFMQGYTGYIVSRNMAWYCFLKYSKLKKLTQEKTSKKMSPRDVQIASAGWKQFTDSPGCKIKRLIRNSFI